MTPTTVFTLCDVPHNQGYGSSANSTAKLASRFLQSLAKAMIMAMPTPDFSQDILAFKTVETLKADEKGEARKSKNWSTLSDFVYKLEKHLEQHRTLPSAALGAKLDFSSIANLAGQNLAACNQRVKDNVMLHLEHLYDEQQ